ncbi:hypothetical protein ABPG75_003330 [Micractinium tetrahymenae]
MRALLAFGACHAGSVLAVVGLARQTGHNKQCSGRCASSFERTGQRRAPVGWMTACSTARRRTAAGTSSSGGRGNGSSSSNGSSQLGTDRQQLSDGTAHDAPAKTEPFAAGGAAGPAQPSSAWQPAGRWLAFGGSVAFVLALTVFRREIAPALRWLITQVNNLTDKSLIGEVGEGKLEAILTLLAVALTFYWSFKEFAASNERMKSVEGLEARVAALEASLQSLAAEVAELRSGQAVAERGRREAVASGAAQAVDQLAAELAQLRQEREEAGQPHGRA